MSEVSVMNTRSLEVSVIIKALNEEEHIASAVESALRATKGLRGEVILADSLSTDRTVEIAKAYPIHIVQLVNPEDRCCGVGPQLGYQHARGDFIYILDGDMELEPEFLKAAIAVMRERGELAGVGGQVRIVGGRSYEFAMRKERASSVFSPGPKEALECGGLYRRAALEQVGYFSNRNLHAFEEKELGLRLTHQGWRLERLAQPAVLHHVHQDDSVGLMRKRWRSHYVDGCGELIRASWGKPYFWRALRTQKMRLVTLAGWLVWLLGLLLLPWTYWGVVLALGTTSAGLLLLLVRKGSFEEGMHGFMNLQIYAAGFVRGFLAPQVCPTHKIQCQMLANGDASDIADRDS
ncbi:MAG: hypothetical protein B7Y26_11605 [Hydrogenophilales bacterium 16-64-46]|nr:MAG: hypothetical protein B7Z32_11110 [Hydrogenophilales bacterium 12-64-13]OYZ04369.1 MAG: hypothetical protein B7Y26_11605 [Hydrogenophilales bacterium 16-64-46]OZA38266.1 MAG: hypothetical protein B7X87_07145 [Hydrogenophilales bacterium 17-64-34]